MSIHIREATQDDISQIHTIYSFYVRESVATFLRQPPPLESLISSFREIQSRGLPYRVAIDTTGKVLGYGYLAPFNGTRMAYAPTVEVSLYVHPEYTSKGVGSRLLSSILESVESEAGVWHRACEHKEYESHVQVIPEDEGRVCSIMPAWRSILRGRRMARVCESGMNNGGLWSEGD